MKLIYKNINPSIAELKKDISNNSLSRDEELPDINKSYPYTVEGKGKVNAEIFVSSEKAGSGKDGILNEIAEDFNNQNYTINGETISVSIRSIPSGTAVDYISSKNYVPDGYTPSNTQWNYILNAKGTNTKSTGLSLLTQLLYSFDKDNPISDTAKEQFKKLQENIPSTFVTTTQLREAAKSGTADILSISYQTYINTPEFADYKYIPLGIRQDSPLYSITNNTQKQEILKKFSEFGKNENNQNKASSYGFNQLNDYSFNEQTKDGNVLMSIQNLWKKNKNSSRPIVGVFVTDISGSMEGEPINKLKQSLLNSLQYINEDNYIGLVSYSSNVTINVPIDSMNNNQKAYFTSAIKGLTANGGTATYDGTLVAIKMIQDKLKEHPNARPVIFVLSDGETNTGHSFERVEPIIRSLGITVNTIGYNANLKELSKLSKINESVSIDAENNDVIYKIKELFNAEF